MYSKARHQLNYGLGSEKSPSSGVRDSVKFESNNKDSRNPSEYTFQGNNAHDNASSSRFRQRQNEDDLNSLQRFQSPNQVGGLSTPIFVQQQKPRAASNP